MLLVKITAFIKKMEKREIKREKRKGKKEKGKKKKEKK